jgi:O-antigen/teichoic acid export membrane protein
MKFTFGFPDVKLLKEVGAFSAFILIASGVDQINWNGPNFLLGMLLGAKSSAIYSVGYQIMLLFSMIASAFSGVFIPQINNIVANNEGNQKLTELMVKIGRIQIIVLTFIFGGFAILGKFFIQIWAGDGYGQSFPIALLLVAPSIITSAQSIGMDVIRAKNKHKFISIAFLVLSVINIGLTAVLIIKVGVVGAAIGTFLYTLLGPILLNNWYMHKENGLDIKLYWKNMVNLIPQIIFPLGIILIFTRNYPINSISRFVVVGIIYAMIYLVLTIIFGLTKSERKMFLSKILKKN